MKTTAINHTAALAAQSKYSTTPLRALNPRTLTVDIVLPVLNEAYILEESVRTLCMYMEDNLPYHYQIIIADNGSTDGTRRVAAMLAEHFPAVRVVCDSFISRLPTAIAASPVTSGVIIGTNASKFVDKSMSI